MEEVVLQAETIVPVRFNEVDSMHIVWHGVYATYFELAREAFGDKYNVNYLAIYDKGYFTPLVELNIRYRRPLIYGSKARIVITFKNTETAKIIFEYKIFDAETGVLAATGSTVQVFTNAKTQKLEWLAPEFFIDWKKQNGLL